MAIPHYLLQTKLINQCGFINLGSLDKWREAKVRGVWFKVALADSAWVPHLAQVNETQHQFFITSLSPMVIRILKQQRVLCFMDRMDFVIIMPKLHMS